MHPNLLHLVFIFFGTFSINLSSELIKHVTIYKM